MEENGKEKLGQMKDFIVIGLGRFGKTIAKSLYDSGKEVLAIDVNPEAVKMIQGSVSSSVVANALGADVLKSLGAENFDCAVIGIGADIQSSILVTSVCKELGIKYVVAKAKDELHKKILEKIGADLAIVPEYYMARKIAEMLANPNVYEVMQLTDDIKIVEIKTPAKWQNKSLEELKLRRKYSVTVDFVKRNGEVLFPADETVLLEGDSLVIAGDISNLDKILNKLDDSIDIQESIASYTSTSEQE